MKVSIVPYEGKYREGVMGCFQRNYKAMAHLSPEKIYAWAKPMFTYSWQEDISLEEAPYKYGVVLLAGDNVIGYLGFIYEKRQVQGKTLLYTSGTTWAIDEGYRIYLFSAVKKAIKNADVVLDLSAIGPVRETMIKVFKFRIFDDTIREFPPVPSLQRSVTVKNIIRAAEIGDFAVKREFTDHVPYPVFCVKAETGEDACYLFYKTKERVKTKYFGRQKCVEILSVSNKKFFSRHAHEIIWQLQKKEHAHLRCDSHFFDDGVLRYHGYVKHNGKRLILNKTGQDIPIDYLYTEFAMLGVY